MQQHADKWRPFMVTGVAVSFALMFGDSALAQDAAKPVVVQQGDTFPAALGYAALGVASTVWATLAAVVGKLYFGREQDRKDYQAQLDTIKKDAQAQVDTIKREAQAMIDALKKECKDEIGALRDRLEIEQKERREEAEKLLREQKDIMREVMVTCGAISDALRKNTETLERMSQAWRDEP